jgi:cation diffusion facilitator CzcD-associated flavoprotein CzcO
MRRFSARMDGAPRAPGRLICGIPPARQHEDDARRALALEHFLLRMLFVWERTGRSPGRAKGGFPQSVRAVWRAAPHTKREGTLTPSVIKIESEGPREMSTSVGRSREIDAVIVGAGPYGLAAAAHLREAGVEVAVFGEPMAFWRQAMPAGMFLRSPWDASTIADPRGRFTLDRFQAARGVSIPRRIPVADFMEYAMWFADEVVGSPDPRRVARVERSNQFHVRLQDGEELKTRRVVVAAGLDAFAYRPDEFALVGSERITHAASGVDVQAFAGRRVLVIGGGQTAVETATLLAESGAQTEVVLRADEVHWLGRSARLHSSRLIRRLMYAPSDVGPPGVSWVVHFPHLVRRLPRRSQDWMTHRSLRPAASSWLIPRSRAVRVTTSRCAVRVDEAEDAVRVVLDNGSSREVDHVVLGTGYRPDVRRYAFLSQSIIGELDLVDGLPRLDSHFESSVPGLHFVGAAATYAFGPLMRFVAGTGCAGRALATRSLWRARTGSE